MSTYLLLIFTITIIANFDKQYNTFRKKYIEATIKKIKCLFKKRLQLSIYICFKRLTQNAFKTKD
jgi:hypothetical protein